jgi:hypothetical protein
VDHYRSADIYRMRRWIYEDQSYRLVISAAVRYLSHPRYTIAVKIIGAGLLVPRLSWCFR